MSSSKTVSNRPAWDTIIMQIKNNRVPEPELIKSAYLEHSRLAQQVLEEEIAEAIELRETWMENAEILHPSNVNSLDTSLNDVLEHQTSTSKPNTPNVSLMARIPFLRKFIK